MNIVKLLEIHEGFVPHAYEDSEGYLTIGIGRLIDKRKGGHITRDEAAYLLSNDVRRFKEELNRRLPWWKHETKIRRLALLDMAFNLGVDGLMGFDNMLTAIQGGDYHRAAAEALDSRWARQVGARSKHIAHMLKWDELPQELRND